MTARRDSRNRRKRATGLDRQTGQTPQLADETGVMMESLTGKMSLTRICEVHHVNHKQVHAKIVFFYRQAGAMHPGRCTASEGGRCSITARWFFRRVSICAGFRRGRLS